MNPTRRFASTTAFTAAIAIASGLFAATEAHALDLTVEITDARSAQGAVNAALYGGEDGWLKTAQAVQLQTRKADSPDGKTVMVFTGLSAGRYALSVYHDENGNGKMDHNIVGLPTERYGFTRDARGTMGPPSFADAAVDLRADATLRVTLR